MYTNEIKNIRASINHILTENPQDRESYLSWRTRWKRVYADLSRLMHQIRASRKHYEWKRTVEATSYTAPNGQVRVTKKRTKVGPNPKHWPNANYWLPGLKIAAKSMIDTLLDEKQKAAKRLEAKKAA